MFASKIRVGMLGLMVMLLVGSYTATAYAEPGPFCHQRVNSEGGIGNKITEAAPEFVQGEGGEQTLEGSGAKIHAASVQVKGIIYNNKDQCQAKLELKYHTLSLIGLPSCVVTVGTDNSVKVFGHLAWKWNGTTKQLEENPQKEQVPDWIFMHSELNTGGELKELPKGESFTTISFKGNTTECGVLSGTTPKVEGSAGVTILSPGGLEKWSKKESDEVEGGQLKQHIWVSGLKPARFVGVETGLRFNGTAKLAGGFTLNSDFDEVAYFEKS